MKPLLYAAILLFVQALAACGEPVSTGDTIVAERAGSEENHATQDEPSEYLVVAFGDSLYAGYNLEQNEGFAPVLEEALRNDGLSVTVLNAGVSGDTTAAGRERLAFTLDGLDRAPDLVIVGLGGNDMLRGISPDQTRANLAAILDELVARDIDAMLTGMVAAPNLGEDYAAAFNPIYQELSVRYEAPLYPFLLDGVIQDPSLMLADGIHPNAAGIAGIVDEIAPLVADELSERR